MNELGLDPTKTILWFPPTQTSPYTLIQVSNENAKSWAHHLGVAVRRCYITDKHLADRAALLGLPASEILASKMPDPGSTMSGDFGEIITFILQSSQKHPQAIIGPKKWRLKQDRTKPAPHSDVIHFLVPNWPSSSSNDALLCAEVKTKSLEGSSTPIKKAIEDSAKDRVSRLGRTLTWLRERALNEDLGELTIAHLSRFINATNHPPAAKNFSAVAILCSSLTKSELKDAPTQASPDYSVIIMSIPELKATYTSIFDAATQSATTSIPLPPK
ncbi:Hachiman antiphage defense system protein HamA [Corallococcus exiguus]|uniref:Hachiman antiphage defense system protein HamA n=1 Tax=Corallococcus exiguus TaxID=83462 RepID=UPI0015610A18|nr:Hachiman antiphage defense system protein HamA [Corallococcus exiguus]NRD57032.1 DUF1837 domain-containing protein [Corallococcus exiguus]